MVIRGIGGGCDEEALRAVKEARFKPGRQRGKVVPVKMSLPITFKLTTKTRARVLESELAGARLKLEKLEKALDVAIEAQDLEKATQLKESLEVTQKVYAALQKEAFRVSSNQ